MRLGRGMGRGRVFEGGIGNWGREKRQRGAMCIY